MLTADFTGKSPVTEAVRRAMQRVANVGAEADLLFLEAWEIQPSSHVGSALRASQIRRANPGLAEEISHELRARRS
jgi:hypothetical protein